MYISEILRNIVNCEKFIFEILIPILKEKKYKKEAKESMAAS